MKMFRPNEYKKSVLHIDYVKLEREGKKLLCFDVDNTLDYPDLMTEELLPLAKETFKKLEKMNFEVILVSNNTIKGRVEKFASLVNKEYIHSMRKPFLKKYKENKTINSYNKNEIVFIGDKIVTDVIGGNRFGSYTILIDPIKEKGNKPHQKIMKVSDTIFSKAIRFKRGEYY